MDVGWITFSYCWTCLQPAPFCVISGCRN